MPEKPCNGQHSAHVGPVPSDEGATNPNRDNTATPSSEVSPEGAAAAADTRPTAPSGGRPLPVTPRRLWSCGEASWLEEVAHLDTDARRDLLGYPLRFTARETLALHRAGVPRPAALDAPRSVTADDLILLCRASKPASPAGP